MPTRHADRLMPTLRRVVLGRQAAARTDGELLGAFVASNEGDAFAELVRRHGPMVLGVCRRLVPDHATADDAFQATFLVLARRAAGVRPRERVGNWLYGVAYRTALKARMVLARRRSREKQVDAMPEPSAPGAPPVWADLQPVIDEELARLPEKLRVPVVLCDLEGRAQREVAKQLGVPPATLATRLASARRTLAARLTRRGVTLSGGALAGLLGLHAAAGAVPHPLAAGVVRAAVSLAAGGSAGALVSARAVQLSEGVVQMMLLAKLKAVAVGAAVALALTTGLGMGLAPAAAEDRLAAGAAPQPAPPDGAKSAAPPDPLRAAVADRLNAIRLAEPEADDATFLRRLSLDVRGTVPTVVETWFFVSDPDDEKRAKVVEWITDDDEKRAAIAKKLGVPAERVQVFRARLSADGRFMELGREALNPASLAKGIETSLAFTADGAKLVAGESGKVVVYDAGSGKPVQALISRTAPGGAGPVQVWGTLTSGQQQNEGFFRTWAAPNQWVQSPPVVGGGTNHLIQNRVAVGTDGKPTGQSMTFDFAVTNSADSDAEFLKRVLTDARGSGPTALELKYFTEDKDVKKREKLVDTLLKEPAVQKKLGDEWKKKVLAAKTASLTTEGRLFYFVAPEGADNKLVRPGQWLNVQPGQPFVAPLLPDAPKPPVPPKPLIPPVPPKPPTLPVPPTPPTPMKVVVSLTPPVQKLEKLVGELIAAKKSDEALLEALTLAALSRLPTDAEKKLVLAAAGNATDRKAAWVAVARALADSSAPDVPKPKAPAEPKPPAPPKP